MCVPGRGEAGPEGISFGLRAAERGWCVCVWGWGQGGGAGSTAGREQAQGVGRSQIEGPRGLLQTGLRLHPQRKEKPQGQVCPVVQCESLV